MIIHKKHKIYTIKVNHVTQSKSKTQYQDVCMVSSIVLLLTLMGHNVVFIQHGISFQTQSLRHSLYTLRGILVIPLRAK